MKLVDEIAAALERISTKNYEACGPWFVPSIEAAQAAIDVVERRLLSESKRIESINTDDVCYIITKSNAIKEPWQAVKEG